MQVTLTPHAEQLLRAALARDPDQSPETIVEQALAGRLNSAATKATADPVWEKLSTIPGVQLPAHWPPRFATFEPVVVEGEPVSDQLIRERR